MASIVFYNDLLEFLKWLLMVGDEKINNLLGDINDIILIRIDVDDVYQSFASINFAIGCIISCLKSSL